MSRFLRGYRQAMLALGGLLLLDSALLVGAGKINLGTVLPGLLGILVLAGQWQREAIARWQQRPWFRLAWNGAMAGLALWLISLAAFVAWTLHLSAVPAQSPVGSPYLIVLGAGLRGTEPSPTLQARLDAALAQAGGSPDRLFVVSGGQGLNEDISEAAAMAAYLQRRGVPATRILLEDRSTSTWENLANSAALLRARGWQPSSAVAVVTSDFHLVRAHRIAAKAGFANARMVSAPTPLAIRPNSWLREYFATVSSWLAGEL